MSHVFRRFDATGTRIMTEEAEGTWVSAQDAYDKVASLSDEIKTLKTQLKDAKKAIKSFDPVGAYHDGRILYAKSTP